VSSLGHRRRAFQDQLVRDRPNVARAAYLIDGYVEADDALKNYERSGRGTDLLRIGGPLPNTHALGGGRQILERTCKRPIDADTQRITKGLEQIDDLLGLEGETLAREGLSPDVVRDLLEAIRQVPRFLDWPDDVAAESFAMPGQGRGVRCRSSGYRAENQPVRYLIRALHEQPRAERPKRSSMKFCSVRRPIIAAPTTSAV
jgi:hypothetical protein